MFGAQLIELLYFSNPDYRCPETLSDDVLAKMGAPGVGKDDELASGDKLEAYDGIMFGLPTRFGMAPAQMKALMDSMGKQWQSGGENESWGETIASDRSLKLVLKRLALTARRLSQHFLENLPVYSSPPGRRTEGRKPPP